MYSFSASNSKYNKDSRLYFLDSTKVHSVTIRMFSGFEAQLRNLFRWISQRVIQLWAVLRAHPYIILLFAAVLIYGVVFSNFTVLKHSLFQTSGWDLGVFDQALYTTLHEGKLFYYTADLFLNPSGCYFAQHLSPIMFLVLPFYAINSSSVTLLVFKSFILANISKVESSEPSLITINSKSVKV